MSSKGQRTVYRLTLVKGWNAEEMDNYAKLVAIGEPDFIEVKGVTYCGTSKGETDVLCKGVFISSFKNPRTLLWLETVVSVRDVFLENAKRENLT